MAETTFIVAAATTILKLCEDWDDQRTQLKRLAYAAEVLKCHACVELAKLDSMAEIHHE